MWQLRSKVSKQERKSTFITIFHFSGTHISKIFAKLGENTNTNANFLLQKCSLFDSLTSIIKQSPPCFKTSVNWGLLSLPQTWTFSTALFWGLGLRSTSLNWLFAPGWGGWGFYMIIYKSWLTLLPGAFPMWLLCPIVWSWIWQIIKVLTDS